MLGLLLFKCVLKITTWLQKCVMLLSTDLACLTLPKPISRFRLHVLFYYSHVIVIDLVLFYAVWLTLTCTSTSYCILILKQFVLLICNHLVCSSGIIKLLHASAECFYTNSNPYRDYTLMQWSMQDISWRQEYVIYGSIYSVLHNNR